MVDYEKEYDTDEISLTSTVLSVQTETYTVEDILSERWDTFKDGSEGMTYLVQWEDYPIYRCKKSRVCDLVALLRTEWLMAGEPLNADRTWEPKEHLADTDFLDLWNQKKRRMGKDAFETYMEKNEDLWEEAVTSFDAAKERRKAKRDKKRTRLRLLKKQKNLNKVKKRATPLAAVDDGGTKDGAPPRLQEWVREQRALSPKTALATREAIDSSQLNNLFMESQDDPTQGPTPTLGQPEGDLFVRQPLALRNPPLEQSESSSEDEAEEAFDDSLMGESQKKAKKAKGDTGDKPPPRQLQATQKSTHAPKSPQETVTSARKKNNESRRLSQPSVLPATSDQAGKATATKSTDLVEKDQRSINNATTTASSTQAKPSRATETQPTKLASSTDLGRSVANTAIKKAAPRSKVSGGIRIVNEPKTRTRAEWQNGNNLFNKLKFRRLAVKRSHAEGTPDPGALDIVNAPAGYVKPSPQPPSENPYGRRESGNRRLWDNDPDDTPRRGSVDEVVPLLSWEIDKIPQVCPQWRLSNNCEHGPHKCFFMHRNQDALGRDYPVGDMHGYIPPKYRKPPLTCPYWLTSKMGCWRLDDECNYAHKNTGWIPLEGRRDEPFAINPNATPESEKQVGHAAAKLRRFELTCWFWKMSHCRKGIECNFQHYDTGVMADPPPSAITCWHWANGNKCPKSADTCKFRHLHTGFMSDPPGKEPTLTPDLLFGPIPDLEALEALATQEAQPDVVEHQPQTPIQKPPAEMTCLQMKAKIGPICKLDFMDMFSSNEGDIPQVDRRAFLIFHPEEHSEELDLITRWLLMHHVEVGNVWYDGSWDSFKLQILGGGSGVIIAHPDFEYFTELPGFGQVLQKQVRVWSVGLQEGIEYDAALSDAPPELRQDRIEIFPLGGFIYITDDVFEKKPQVALKIVQSFFAKIERARQLAGPITPWHEVDDAALFWRLCVRPELMEHLLHHCQDHARELEMGDADMQSRAELYTILCESNYIEQDDPTTPLSLVADKYPILSERRVMADSPPVDYFNTLRRSQEDANLHMLRYYAGLQVEMRRDYRHLFVVHTEPDARCVQQWKQEIQTIAGVITPEKCVEEFGKEGGEGLFDFYERYMPEYEVKDWRLLPVTMEGVEQTTA